MEVDRWAFVAASERAAVVGGVVDAAFGPAASVAVGVAKPSGCWSEAASSWQLQADQSMTTDSPVRECRNWRLP